jgi:hypothetical protein
LNILGVAPAKAGFISYDNGIIFAISYGGRDMKRLTLLSGFILAFLCGASTVQATPSLFDWGFHIDGLTYEYSNGDTIPMAGALDPTGLGSLTWSTTASGTHKFIAFFDHDFDKQTNTFFNEYGAAIGSPTANQTWEIDEPGYVFGNIYSNMLAGLLDNTNAVPSGSPDDVSWALGWDFILPAGSTAVINLFLSAAEPSSGFYLSHTDPDSRETIYFSGILSLRDTPQPVPEPSALLMFASGLAACSCFRRNIRRQG